MAEGLLNILPFSRNTTLEEIILHLNRVMSHLCFLKLQGEKRWNGIKFQCSQSLSVDGWFVINLECVCVCPSHRLLRIHWSLGKISKNVNCLVHHHSTPCNPRQFQKRKLPRSISLAERLERSSISKWLKEHLPNFPLLRIVLQLRQQDRPSCRYPGSELCNCARRLDRPPTLNLE